MLGSALFLLNGVAKSSLGISLAGILTADPVEFESKKLAEQKNKYYENHI